MVIEKKHLTTKSEAKEKIDSFLTALMKQEFLGGIKIKNAEKNWNGDTMNFSFKAKKGLIGTTISGKIIADKDSVTLTSELPSMVTTFVSEDKIKDLINKQFNELFGL